MYSEWGRWVGIVSSTNSSRSKSSSSRAVASQAVLFTSGTKDSLRGSGFDNERVNENDV